MQRNELLISTGVLTLCCLLSAMLLSMTYSITKERIDEQAVIALNEKLKQVFPEATEFVPKEDYYEARKNATLLGYAAIAKTSGYRSILKILIGIDMEKKITGIRILDQAETPGLGTEIAKPGFYEQFSNLSSSSVALKKYQGDIDGITGATISSKAVTEGIRNALQDKLEKLVASK